jgi:hypothetical protein
MLLNSVVFDVFFNQYEILIRTVKKKREIRPTRNLIYTISL